MAAKWKKVLGAVAPLLRGAFGGPMGGMVATMAAEALGLDAGTSDKAIQEALAGPLTDAQYTALHEADIKFKERCAELEVELEAVHQKDRASARAMHMKTGDKTTPLLAVATVGGFFATLVALFFSGGSLDAGTRDVLMTMVGILGTMTVGVYNFYFGSSAGSKAKTGLLGKDPQS